MIDVYTVKGYCTNCGYKGDITITKGKRIPLETKFGHGINGFAIRQWSQGSAVKCPTCGNYSCYADGKSA